MTIFFGCQLLYLSDLTEADNVEPISEVPKHVLRAPISDLHRSDETYIQPMFRSRTVRGFAGWSEMVNRDWQLPVLPTPCNCDQENAPAHKRPRSEGPQQSAESLVYRYQGD